MVAGWPVRHPSSSVPTVVQLHAATEIQTAVSEGKDKLREFPFELPQLSKSAQVFLFRQPRP